VLIKGPHLKAARRHAQRLGSQISNALDNGHDGENGDAVERLLRAWAEFIDQFGDTATGDTVARDYVSEGFRVGVSGVNPHLELVLVPGP
jgi:hypothetical protein